jgi:hypothetical protein
MRGQTDQQAVVRSSSLYLTDFGLGDHKMPAAPKEPLPVERHVLAVAAYPNFLLVFLIFCAASLLRS